MKKILAILAFAIAFCGSSNAQLGPQDVGDQEKQKRADARMFENNRRTAERRNSILTKNDALSASAEERKISLGRGRYKKLPRELTKENLKSLEPEMALYKKYEKFLAEPNTGLIKLLPDIGCRQSLIIDASSPCVINASIPGDGAAYSFRKKTYEEVELSDLLFKDGKFQARGTLTQGIMFKLGTVPVETISLDSDGMKYLVNFVPAKKSKDAAAQKAGLESGIGVGSFNYSTEKTVSENMTYGLRSVAYRGSGMTDNRRDVIVVFQVVRQYEDGSIAVAWKQLWDAESPKMKNETTGGRFY